MSTQKQSNLPADEPQIILLKVTMTNSSLIFIKTRDGAEHFCATDIIVLFRKRIKNTLLQKQSTNRVRAQTKQRGKEIDPWAQSRYKQKLRVMKSCRPLTMRGNCYSQQDFTTI